MVKLHLLGQRPHPAIFTRTVSQYLVQVNTFMMSSPVASTLGLWLVTLFLTSILYGMGLLQAYLYFFWYPKDGWFTKSAVISVVVLETAQIALFFSASYKMFIDGFGQFGPDSILPWEAKVQLLALTLSTFVAQEYFAHMLYLIGNKRIIYPIFVALVAVASLGAGIAQVTILFTLQTWAELVRTSVTINVESATAFACDLFITIGLCWHLNTSRTGIQSTNKLINFLIMTSINRGVFTMVFAMLTILLWLTKQGSFNFILMNLLCGKFYMNSLLAVLNTREHAHSLGHLATTGSVSIGLTPLPSHRARIEPIGVTVTVVEESTHDRADENKYVIQP
ncbi:hypothetical protein C8R45DRAFT_1105854 [Mycena sanguinolenta]|nr:hypothetical protein C8R45DRAFT_1105854 [Mycena sanguinolenta]